MARGFENDWLGVTWWVHQFDNNNDYATRNDKYYYNFFVGGSGHDDMYGGSYYNNGVDWMFGGAGQDYMYGGGGNDLLAGGVGPDNYFGGRGNDTLIDANDGEADRFYFSNAYGNFGSDFIMGFDPGTDRIWSEARVTDYENRSGDLWLKFGSSGEVLIDGAGGYANRDAIDDYILV